MGAMTRRSFTVSHEAWYWTVTPHLPKTVASISVHNEALAEDGEHDGVEWEFAIDWIDLGDQHPAVKVSVFDDAFAAFTEEADFFAALPFTERPVTPATVTRLLTNYGFVDVTHRTDPDRVPR